MAILSNHEGLPDAFKTPSKPETLSVGCASRRAWRSMPTPRTRRGQQGEALARRHLESLGFRVLAANYDNPIWKHCYLHPKDTFGALIQVFEENEKTLADSGD